MRNIRWQDYYPYFPKGKALIDDKGRPVHPVFVPYGVTSRTPFLETDYNLHKSNSTYFSDLDVARTALVTRIYSPGVKVVGQELDRELRSDAGKSSNVGKSMYIAVGSVYCTFKREIKPFELYEVECKVLAWDQKWLYIISFFLRPASKKGGKKTLLATALTKYVVKKGRLTVPPERIMRASGFLPAPPAGVPEPNVYTSTDVSASATPADGEGIAASTGVDGSLVREVLTASTGKSPDQQTLNDQKKANAESWNSEEWTYEMIDRERRRGLQLVEGYASLDDKLNQEWEG